MRALFMAFALLASPAVAQTPDIPRTAGGRPDFGGYWVSEFLTPLERPDEFKTLIIPPEREAEAIKTMTPDFGDVYDPELDYFFPKTLLTMNGELRSSILVEPEDGKLPLTALAKAAIAGFERDFDGPENRPDAERCVDGVVSAPLRLFGSLAPQQIVQARDAFVLVAEDMNPARIVPLEAGSLPIPSPTRSGHSRGRWDGDTLVVETTGFLVDHPSGLLWRGEAVVTADSKVIERFALLGANEILFQFTIVDPAVYTRPWLAEFPLHRTELATQEYACHEGNHALLNVLSAARMGLQEEKPQLP